MNRQNRYADLGRVSQDHLLCRGTCFSGKYVVIMSVVLLVMLLLVVFALYKWVVYHIRQPLELFFCCMLIYLLVERCVPRYTICLDRQKLSITKNTLWGTCKTFTISLTSIADVFHYKTDMMGLTRYRRTYCLYSALDDESVWTLVYDVSCHGKMEKRRVFFKPGDSVIQALKKTLRHKIAL